MHRKGLVIVILILMLGVNIGSTFAGDIDVKTMSSAVFDGNTLYVGGSGPNNYTRIQDAVDNSSDGDTVFVYSGFYDDYFPQYLCCVKIHKSINLVGEDKYTTIIDGGFNFDVVRIYADYVDISGFTIQNSGVDDINRCGVDDSQRDIKYYKVHDNIIKDNYVGVSNDGTPECEIYDNIISNNTYGFYIYGIEVSIHGNFIQDNIVGIYIYSHDVTVQNNELEGNEVGVQLYDSSVDVIENNFISNTIQAEYVNVINIPYGNMKFRGNYWDNWKLPIPKPIRGYWGYFSIILFDIIGPFPGFRIDWTPALTPHDIEVT